MACVVGGSSYGDNQVEEGEEEPWKMVTHKKPRKPRSLQIGKVSSRSSKIPIYEHVSGGRGEDASAVKSGGCGIEKIVPVSVYESEFPPLLLKPVHAVKLPLARKPDPAVMPREFDISLPGDTDIESCDGEEDGDEEDDDEDHSDACFCDDETWEANLEDAVSEIRQFSEQLDKVKVEEKLKLKMVKYHVYVDAYLRRNRKPRFGIVVKDASKTVLFGCVEKSTSSRCVPQLHTQLEGMLKAAKLAKAHIDKEIPQGGNIRVYVYSNFSHAFGVVEKGWLPVDEQFTKGVSRLLKELTVFFATNEMVLRNILKFENRAADYLARSLTLNQLRGKILEKDFDEKFKHFSKQDELARRGLASVEEKISWLEASLLVKK